MGVQGFNVKGRWLHRLDSGGSLLGFRDLGFRGLGLKVSLETPSTEMQ